MNRTIRAESACWFSGRGEAKIQCPLIPTSPHLTQLNLSWIFIRLLLDLALLAVDQDEGID